MPPQLAKLANFPSRDTHPKALRISHEELFAFLLDGELTGRNARHEIVLGCGDKLVLQHVDHIHQGHKIGDVTMALRLAGSSPGVTFDPLSLQFSGSRADLTGEFARRLDCWRSYVLRIEIFAKSGAVQSMHQCPSRAPRFECAQDAAGGFNQRPVGLPQDRDTIEAVRVTIDGLT